MNKISDLKVGDQVVTNNYGKAIVAEINEHGLKLKYSETKVFGCPYFMDWEIDWQKTNELNNKQMEFKIAVPQGFEIDKEKSTFEKIVFKEIENKLPMSVEEIPNRNWFIGGDSIVYNTNGIGTKDKNQLSTEERAKAFIALMQLVELRDKWNGDSERHGSAIVFSTEYNGIRKVCTMQNGYTLSFKSPELRDQFAEQFKDLIETAKELL